MHLRSHLSYSSTKPAFSHLLAHGNDLAKKYGRPLHTIGIVTSVRNRLQFVGLEAEEELKKPDLLFLHTREAVTGLPPASYWSESSEPGDNELFDVRAGRPWDESSLQLLDARPFWADDDPQVHDDESDDDDEPERYCLASLRSGKMNFQEIEVVAFSPLEWAIAEILSPAVGSAGSVVDWKLARRYTRPRVALLVLPLVVGEKGGQGGGLERNLCKTKTYSALWDYVLATPMITVVAIVSLIPPILIGGSQDLETRNLGSRSPRDSVEKTAKTGVNGAETRVSQEDGDGIGSIELAARGVEGFDCGVAEMAQSTSVARRFIDVQEWDGDDGSEEDESQDG
ncbi:hypothetical protein JAAARDRAFT_46005 [Jaapia argillacea MUCL 33604]|uniref:Uncharacterized protein n=1 Tax=Jaapia argillacea MUCL 33604 TaxID=933084 RepID=A0A067Q217_9AGAM|nr:hypothetical protein JAAARDRAFT_46005 [Jaapia argillacea MUCL 33604]